MITQRTFIDHVRRFGVWAGIIVMAAAANANPISMPQKPITLKISFLITIAILLEVICICVILRRSKTPRLFFLWLIGLHLFTYPSFLGLLGLLQDMRPACAVADGEGLVVLTEGGLIYLICRFVAPAKPGLPAPSIARCW